MCKKVCRRSRLCLLLAGIFLFGVSRPLSADFRFTVTGDPRNSYSRWEWTLSEMASNVSDEGVFHITAGDYYEDGAITIASGFYERLKIQFGDDVVWYPTVGNHEIDTTDMPWLRSFYDNHLAGSVNPGPGPSPCHKTTYSWDYQNAHFVQLNMYYDGTTDEADGAFRDALYNWLIEDLDKNTKPVVFVIYHEPAYPDDRGGKDSPAGWERFWKLLNDRKVIAGLCAHTHMYARYQVDGDWETFTWEVDAGNAGRLSHGDPWQTFIDITVYDNGEVQFVTWQGMETEEFTVTDTWTAVAPTAQLIGPADGATVDANGAVLSCEPMAGAVSYQLMFGPDGNHMTLIAPEGAEPPTDIISTFPFEETWWTIRVRVSPGYTVYGIPRHIRAEKVSAQAIENLTKGTSHDYIQDAIDKAEAGDEIVVGGGIWKHYGAINFKGKNLTLRSTEPNDPDVVAATVIKGNNWQPVATFSGGEDVSCVLAGFTLTDGNEGVYCELSNPTISNCMIADNGGTGILCVHSNPTISDCRIAGNGGAGIKFSNEGPVFYNVIVNCSIVGNAAEGIYGELMNIPLIVNCLVAANGTKGIHCQLSRMVMVKNCTIVENGDEGLYSLRDWITIDNCIIRGNAGQDGPEIYSSSSSMSVNFSNVQGGWEGIGNIDADPCFVLPGYWADANDPNVVVEPSDPNAVWTAGDYHLLGGSPCIDAGDNDRVAPDKADLDGDGNTTEPIPFDLDGNPRVVDGNNDGNAVVDMGAYEFFVPPMEVAMKFTPQALNPGSEGKWVKAHCVLPEGYTVEEVDANTPAKLELLGIEVQSDYINVFVNDDNLVEVEIAFERGAFCGAGTNDDWAEATVTGLLTSGQYFYGTDTIKIINNNLKCLAVFASHWLEADCGKPDWCEGVDLDQDSVVNFVDFVLFDGCCIEVIAE